ncbi:hypothetical protein RJ639_038333 [Escallonia herrerae]|uniref:Uncharacterized protein n=1 Tax=Escallonia herrerae TaxID=1293975 RepID=A0AA89BA46_9ASTE|nr:hypothetical protein RJ639_038333 [Escallonia herrerae]
MAGLQYKFFPTDFLFPRQTITKDSTAQQVVPMMTQKLDESLDSKQSIALVRRDINSTVTAKALPSSSQAIGLAEKQNHQG